MNILGLNGWGTQSHDSSACLMVDGNIAAYAEEERFSRRKHAYDAIPLGSALFCLANGALTLDDIDMVAFGWDMPELLRRHGAEVPGERELLNRLLPPEHFPRRRVPHVEFISHHIAHAASAFLFSGDTEAEVFVFDGQGEAESATVATANGVKITPQRTLPIGWSLGYMYEAACEYAGLRSHDSGKLMGLAAHGTPRDYLDGDIVITRDGYEMPHVPADVCASEGLGEQDLVMAAWQKRFERLVPRPTYPGGDVDPFEMRHFAATVQKQLERCAMSVIEAADVGGGKIQIAGGVGFNATFNGILSRRLGHDRVFVQPIAGDAGVAMGAAAWVASHSGDQVAPMAGTTAWGPGYTPDTMRAAIEEHDLPCHAPGNLVEAVADLLEAGQVVGWFQGRGEVGPRALGHRSLVALPTQEATRDRINRELKRRELWRPLAPSLTEEFTSTMVGHSTARPYMVVTDIVADQCRPGLRAVVHADGTTRPQTVSRVTQPLYHALIEEVGRRTGMPVVLNTSFNGKDEPVVCTPAEAVRSSLSMGIDALVMGPYLVPGLSAHE